MNQLELEFKFFKVINHESELKITHELYLNKS